MSESNKEFSYIDLLPLFTAENVPAWGPHEAEIEAITWDLPETGNDPSLPGGGLARHPMLYVGEGHNRIYLVNDGKVIWTYDTGMGYELDDIWMQTNGNILFTHMYWCAELTPDKKQVWFYKVPEGCEVHSLQPIGTDKVLMVQNGLPPKVIIMNKLTNEIEYEHEIPYDLSLPMHSQFRRIRMTKENTILLPYLDMKKVVEFDLDFNEVWSYETERPWACDRLENGNTLILDETEAKVKEVNKAGEIVWEFELSAAPEKLRLLAAQTALRLSNGNTIICSQGDYGKGPQLIEVSPEKEVVWCINDWKNLGPATTVQVLTEPAPPTAF